MKLKYLTLLLILTISPFTYLQFETIIMKYDDGSSETFGVAAPGSTCKYMVSFTPPGYPATLLSVMVYIDRAAKFDIQIYGENIAGQPFFWYSIETGSTVNPDHSGWVEVNLEKFDIQINSGVFNVVIYPREEAPTGHYPGVGIDTSSPNAGKSYNFFCGNKSTKKIDGNYMIRIKVRYKRERQGGPPDRSAEAHSIDDFAKVKTFYAKVYYRGEADYDAAYKIRVMMNTQWIADLNKTAYSRGDDPEIFVGGPIANPTVLNYNAAFGVNFVKENGSITLKVKGKTYTYYFNDWGKHDYGVVYLIEPWGGNHYVLGVMGCTRYGTMAAALKFIYGHGEYPNAKYLIVEWNDNNHDGKVQSSECQIIAYG